MMNKFIALLCFLMAPMMVLAIETPAPSPASEVKQRIGLTDFTVTYSRPSVKERVIFGDLVPFDKVWRTGANASTKISFSEEIIFGGQKVAAGEYALYTIPGEKTWTVILSSNTGLWGAGGYSSEEDVARTVIKPSKLTEPAESFLISFDELRNDSGHLVLQWKNTHVAVPLVLFTKDQVQANIQEAAKDMSAWEGGDYASAARAYHEYDLDREKALVWIDQAIKTNDGAFWWLYTKAEILAELERPEEAITVAKKSHSMAKEAGNGGYVTRNEQLIAKLR